ncbi:MAG: tryptophan synthase subunit alpha [Cellvibrionales bacterium TMED49]|nr:tryptophan synthase subunit alpha [Porticoccaceae bacterium]OUU36330.1 MAG: tryptophan synthase subunit alpha [Cellvibrionales bacterium TMED49]
MELATYIRERRQEKELLIMAHVVCGYPSFEENMQALEIMEQAGVDLVELQFPFSEPSADGPIFVRANEESLKSGTTIDQCFDFMRAVTSRFTFKVLMMGYYNTVFKMGEKDFLERLSAAGGVAFILPDLPIAESVMLRKTALSRGIDPIIFMTPTSSEKRLSELGAASSGMVYVVARKGVTGTKSNIDAEVVALLQRCRMHTDVPLGLGFGISNRDDLQVLRGTADVAIIGTAALKTWQNAGPFGLRDFFHALS